MPVSTDQKNQMILRAQTIARQMTDINKQYNGFKEEYDSQDYGNATTGITTAVLIAYGSALTNAEFTDGIAAMDTISSAIETNKTNLYKLAK